MAKHVATCVKNLLFGIAKYQNACLVIDNVLLPIIEHSSKRIGLKIAISLLTILYLKLISYLVLMAVLNNTSVINITFG